MRVFIPPLQRVLRPVERPLAVALMVAALHGLNDAYAAFLHPLLPRLMIKLDLTISLAAALTMILSIAASLAQPVLGHLSDRYGPRLMLVAGPAATAVFLSMIGIAPSFWTLAGLLVLGGLGSAAFHPPGAALAARVTEGKGSGMRHAVFSFGGAVGYAAGPLIAVAAVAAFGLGGLWMAMLPGLAVLALLYRFLPGRPARQHESGGARPDQPGILTLLAGPLGLLFGISAVSAFLQRVFLTFEPIIMATAGQSETSGAVALTLYLGSQAAGTLCGGWLTDRVDRSRLIAWLTGISFPAHLLAFWFAAGSAASFLFVIAAGFLNMAILPPIVVIAQEMAPGRAGRNAGIVMGLAWAAGSVLVLASGALGDAIGARGAAIVSTPVILLGTLLALHPGLAPHRRPSGGAESA